MRLVTPEQRGIRQRALYRRLYQEARRKLQAEDFLERQCAWAHTDYETSYEQHHGRPGFEPALERQLREGAAAAELHPLDESEPMLSLWYCRQRAGAAGAAGALTRVSPPHCASQPFRRTSAFTTPPHLSLHDSPAERPAAHAAAAPARARLDLLDRLQAQGWGCGWSGGPTQHRYPLADVFCDAGRKKNWCDRHEDPIRVEGASTTS